MLSAVGPRNTEQVRQFIAEATGLPVIGIRFDRNAAGKLMLSCEYKTTRGKQKTQKLAMGATGLSDFDQVVDLAVLMTEVIATKQDKKMLELLGD